MKITVILSTYQRCESLKKALQSVACSRLSPEVEWEVLVVDNNSRDQTREVVEEFSLHYPGRFRYIFEPQQGKSFALNAGIRGAHGDILAFVDDDVTVEPTWLQNLTAAFHNSCWAGVGGRVLPEETFAPPRWLSPEEPHALGPLAFFDLGPEARELTEAPFGNNMAFRRTMFEKYGGFRTDLGPNPDSLRRGEDTEFGKRILAAGLRLRYEPTARVFHAVPANRLKKRYFLAWWFDKGRSDLREFGMPAGVRWFCTGIPLFLFRRIAVFTLRWMFAVNPSRRFMFKTRVRWLAGQIVESHRRRESLGS